MSGHVTKKGKRRVTAYLPQAALDALLIGHDSEGLSAFLSLLQRWVAEATRAMSGKLQPPDWRFLALVLRDIADAWESQPVDLRYVVCCRLLTYEPLTKEAVRVWPGHSKENFERVRKAFDACRDEHAFAVLAAVRYFWAINGDAKDEERWWLVEHRLAWAQAQRKPRAAGE